MFKKAAALAREFHMAVIFRLTTHVCHGKEKIAFSAWNQHPVDNTPRFDPDSDNYIPLAATVFPMKRRALERLASIEKRLLSLGFDELVDNGNPQRGIIVAGLPFASVMDALDSLAPASSTAKLAGKPATDALEKNAPDILKLGAVYPFDRARVRAFLAAHRSVKIIEELDPILEADIKALAFDEGLQCRIIGKQDMDETMGECTPGKARTILATTWPDLFPPTSMTASGSPTVQATAWPSSSLPERPPQMCPGCGHRSAFYAIKKALRPDDITVADIGCHTLGYLPPYNMGRVLLSMGHSTSTAAGLSLYNDSRRVVCFLGDATFFHAGLPGIINAVHNDHRVLLVIMRNGTTAMTGHQEHPGTGKNFNGDVEKLTIESVLAGFGVKNVRSVDTYKQKELTSIVSLALEEPGFKVIIASHPCMLKFTREARRKAGWSVHQVRINQDICNHNHECVESFACPSFQRADDGSVTVSPDLCIGDGSCRQTCPADAIIPNLASGAAPHA